MQFCTQFCTHFVRILYAFCTHFVRTFVCTFVHKLSTEGMSTRMPAAGTSPWLPKTCLGSLHPWFNPPSASGLPQILLNPQFDPPSAPSLPSILLSLQSRLKDHQSKILSNLISRPEALNSLRVRPGQHQGRVPLQRENVPQSLVNHARRKASTPEP